MSRRQSRDASTAMKMSDCYFKIRTLLDLNPKNCIIIGQIEDPIRDGWGTRGDKGESRNISWSEK